MSYTTHQDTHASVQAIGANIRIEPTQYGSRSWGGVTVTFS